jgi:hypothetical protein
MIDSRFLQSSQHISRSATNYTDREQLLKAEKFLDIVLITYFFR